jgi:hypothetical protein
MNEKNFKVSKYKNYFKTHILRFKPGNSSVSVWMPTMQLHQSRQATEKYMKLILDMEQAVSKELKTRGLSHDPMKVVVYSLKLVSSWADDFDIRHDLPIEHQATLVVNWYNNAYNEAKEDCEKTLASLKENPIPYIKNWKAHDKYDKDNGLFELGMEDLKEYYGEDPLDVILEKTNEMLELLIKQNKEKQNEV